MLNSEHYNLILSDRLAHLEYLMNHLPKHLRAQAVMVDAKMTSKKGKAKREQAIEDMRAGRKRYLFATYSLAKEGLDIPRLDRLYLTTPQKDFAVVAQSIGRIARTFDGKGEPIATIMWTTVFSILSAATKSGVPPTGSMGASS